MITPTAISATPTTSSAFSRTAPSHVQREHPQMPRFVHESGPDYPATMSGQPAPTNGLVGDERTWPLIAWQWLRRLNWVHLLGLVLIVLGAIYWPNSVTAANQARELLSTGTRATVSTSEVLVAENFKRGGNTVDTIKVRVLIPEIPRKVELRWINPPFGQSITASFSPGWTVATAQTGYAAPFDVRYVQHGGDTVAMADSDIDLAIRQDDGVFGWVLVVGVAVFALAFTPRLVRKVRHSPSP
jgi:hypothetical protein